MRPAPQASSVEHYQNIARQKVAQCHASCTPASPQLLGATNGHAPNRTRGRQMAVRSCGRQGTMASICGGGNSRIMHQAGRSGDLDTPLVPGQLFDCRLLTGTRPRGEHFGPPWVSAASKGRTHGSTDKPCITSKSSCQQGAVHTWHMADLG